MSNRSVLVINNFIPLPKPTNLSKEEKWKFLEREIMIILNNSNLKYANCLEHLYRVAEDLYSQKYPPLLFNLHSLFELHLQEKLELLSKEKQTILSKLEEIWKQYYRHVNTIRNVFLPFDRSSRNFKYNTVQGIAIVLFNNVILMNPDVKMKLMSDLLHKITLERNGALIDTRLIKSVIDMLNTLQIYEQLFQEEFLKTSQLFYEDEGYQLISSMDVPTYLKHTSIRVCQEKNRTETYLNPSTQRELLNVVYKELIHRHCNVILDNGFDKLIEGNISEELSLLYDLFMMIPNGIKLLITRFNSYVLKQGVVLMKVGDKNLIEDLVKFKDNLEYIIKTSFHDNTHFYDSIKKNLKKLVFTRNKKFAHLLAKFADSKLRSKEINEVVLEGILINVLSLFKFLQGKDIFLAFYKRHLARRLLLGKSSSQDAENFMVTKLKEECGDAFTAHIEGMFQDINLSKNFVSAFKSRSKVSNEFSVNILTSSYWPNYPSFNVNLPGDLISYQQTFQGFYLSNHNGRKLLWQPILSHCLIKAAFDGGLKELQVSLFQTIVLLMFNENEEFTFKEIREVTNLERLELVKTLLSLTYGKAKILLKNPKIRSNNKDFVDTDTFHINRGFKDKLYRVRINQIQFQESAEEEKETEKNVLADRQFQIDAAIVRILKNKKRIEHNALIKELYRVLDIPVNQTDLKKRIELLIDREYLERDKNNKSAYIYVA